MTLCAELQRFVTKDERLSMLLLRHPLVYSVPYTPDPFLDDLLNKSLAHKREAALAAAEKEDWGAVLALYERPFRPSILASLVARMSCQEFSALAGEIWIDTEYPTAQLDIWREIFQNTLPEFIMTKEELEYMDMVTPDTPVFRGGVTSSGLSWTANRATAEMFAKRFSQRGKVFEGRLPEPKYAFAFFDRRGEYELVVDTDYVEVL